MNAILIHGWCYKDEYYDLRWPTPSNSHWFPWITKQLAVHDIHTVSVEMPESYYPVYEKWKKEFERYEIGADTMLVGHSCGGGFLLRWLSENQDTVVGKVVLVAPWIGDDPDQPFDDSFFDIELDSSLASRTKQCIIFNSTNDGASVHKSVDKIKSGIQNVTYREFEGLGHFTQKGMGRIEFPELLEELLK